jgi:hypothetical protein
MVNNSMSDDYSEEPKKKKNKSSSDDADELRAIAEALPDLFGAINDSIPKLISGLIGSIYSPEAAGNMAKGIGQFYSNLVAEGIPEEVALEMTKKFVGALDFSRMMDMVSSEVSSERGRKRSLHVEFGDDDEDEDIEDVEYE